MSLKPTDIKYYVHTNKGATPLSDTWGALISVLDSCLITGFSSQTVLTSEILTGNVLKLTYSADHNYLPGQVIKITGANQLEFNVEFRISIVPSTTTLHIDITEALSNKGISGTLTTVLPSLGWSADYTGTGKRAYRNADVTDTARPYLRVVDEKDTLWNSTYAKYAKVGVVESLTDIDTMNGLQTPYTSTDPTRNWIATGTSGASDVKNGWAKWYYSRVRDVFIENYYDSEGATSGNKRWLIVGNKDWIYVMPSQIVSQYCNVYFFGKLITENLDVIYGLGSSLQYDTAANNKATCIKTPFSAGAPGFLFHIQNSVATGVFSFNRVTGQVPSALYNYYENIENKFLYSDVLLSRMYDSKSYRVRFPSLKWNYNPFNSSYDVKVIEDNSNMFLNKTIHASEGYVESPMLISFNLTET